ncbi:class I SAM-dependent methyltransferase [Neorhizobium alkalisoli]|uniref:S-adenosylmethionine-diacylgycerolhomoserine-N-methyltransferase n=1 Tax=Neorhizobium alkalisoli TaxID=528178 RepID=A0A561QVJ4_9HYPH|nr:class I SAM-dependent methyltransferase [Neorhizobium alkalisoli]TWF54398.1 S-adenosylmethionine-diacylgycerolhomoserine-N-methyltransferase [Neorhizobium alkalisoli]
MTGAVAGKPQSGSKTGSHAAQMDRMYRYQRHIYDLTRKYYLLGRDRTIAGLAVPADGTLLEVGCGTGRNMLLAHRHYPAAKLYGLDISAEMLESAKANFRGASVKPVFAVADATAFRPQDFGISGEGAGFDRILISYALSMIPDWEKAIDAALAALAPNGSLHIVDFGQQENLPGWIGRGLKLWLARFHVTPRANLQEALENRLQAADCDMIFEQIGRGYAWHAVLRRRS